MDKMWYTHTTKYYSALKRTEILAWAITLEDVLLSEVSQTQKDKYRNAPLTGGARAVRLTDTERRVVAARAGAEKQELEFSGQPVSVWEERKFWRGIGVMPAQPCECAPELYPLQW